jgi:hypothetical protein
LQKPKIKIEHILVLQTVALGLLWRSEHDTSLETRDLLNEQFTQLSQLFTATSAASLNHVVVSVSDNAVYFPDLHLKLPLNNTTLNLVYSVRANAPGSNTTVIDVDTQSDATYTAPMLQTFSCTPLRLAFESKPNPYNPHEKDDESVTLADGRILQVYAYHQSSCDVQYQAEGMNTDALAAQFKAATSY